MIIDSFLGMGMLISRWLWLRHTQFCSKLLGRAGAWNLLWLKEPITNFAISFVEEVAADYSAYSSLFMFVAFALHLFLIPVNS